MDQLDMDNSTPNMNSNSNGASLYTTVDDDLYDEISELVGQRIVYVGFWDDSLADAMEQTESNPVEQNAFDLDLYLEDGVYFELYGTFFYPDLNSEPLVGLEPVSQRIGDLGQSGMWLEEIAVDESDALILVLGDQGTTKIYLAVEGWLLEEWDELPEE